METTKRRLIDHVRAHCRGPKQATAVPGLTLFRSDHPTEPVRSLYNPRICIVLQGRKQISLDRTRLDVGPDDYLVAVIDLPVSANITEATPLEPHFSLTLDLDAELIVDLLFEEESRGGSSETAGAKTAPQNEDILEPFERLVRLLDRPADIKVIAPLIKREIHYRLLVGSLAALVRQSGTTGTQISRIAEATAWIKANFNKAVSVGDLAQMTGMSVTSFHRAFKSATGSSPLQFRTRLRLHESRRRLLLGGSKAGTIAFEVGYDSQSQFNREYRRMFGVSPLGDVTPNDDDGQ
ncbi:AraC family transcriptional regulator [Rhizobium tumorigenes]|uniref:AraC family transcriptional regulator n=1 Tax=Rhizobium tumorigenes TaxID=2041385 RepID=A0AAF1KSG0_9HYPH|nr:AraC family transcriptional regulator [Rhizobium tumorigenes]WFR97932.1 AraC family transcriptional regulator [Rhizobium tumorigenes]